MNLQDFKILTFDVYGTLIDWETGMFEGLRPLFERLPEAPGRDKVLETHAFHESTQQALTPAMPYSRLLATVYRRIAEEWGIPVTWAECETYGNSVEYWPAFADSAGALQYLQKYYKLAVLSNVDARSFAHSNDKLGVTFDFVYTAEDIGSYKPSDRNFDYMISQLDRMGYAKSDILHTAESMFHDHQPANRHGLTSAWIYRRHDKEGFGATMNPGEMPKYDFRFNSMAELVQAHQKQMSLAS
ncbi:haloacid dehalogenase type II [Poseidonocella sp. HB161398]|uniref:haloacid dehalogenase type II n=1 Tax=Poseidonocella sp. HB161398 TaxID=2320855 RepID=UPI0011091114|nr:haloacid dehalogenase type II [Poseidonocella sp. HB161398]